MSGKEELDRLFGLKVIEDRVLVKRVRLDGGTQPRVEMSESVVDEYAEILDELPPVDLVFDGRHYWPWDGYHRIRAHKKKRRAEIRAFIRKGTREDAVLLSLGVNARHGLQRTNADIRRAVEVLLKNPRPGWTDADIARCCNVNRKTVGNHRRRLDEENKGQTGGVEVPRTSGIPMLPEEWGDVYDALTPEQKIRFEQDQAADLKREQAKQDVSSWLERVETWAARGVALFRGRPEIAPRDLKAVGQRIETVLKTARKYEG